MTATNHWRAASLAIALALLAGPVSAQQTVYVTDVLRLGLHAAEDTSDRAFRSLESGQAMQVLSRDRSFARVRLPDGTEGYVKAAYLVDEKPARLIVDEATSAAAAVQAKLDQVTAEFSGSANKISSLENSLSEAQAEQARLQAGYEEANKTRLEFERKLQSYGFALPWPIALGGFFVALIIGFAGGYWWIDSRSRKRHGGFRIY